MKIRSDFVTNSSSSSFICNICGHTDCGFELGMEEAGFVECEERNHVFCKEHVIQDNDTKNELDDVYVPSSMCPICQLQVVTHSDLVKYFFKKTHTTMDSLRESFKKNFKNYEEFLEFLKEENNETHL